MPDPVRPVLLVVDDEPQVVSLVGRHAAAAGFEVVTATGGREALALLQQRPADVVMVDLRMPEINGLEVLREIRARVPGCEVILMTGYADMHSAVEAIKLGARDYLAKPFQVDRLRDLLTSVLQETERRRNLIALDQAAALEVEFCGMIGRGPAMQEVFSLVRRLAPHLRSALVTGETGVGKELVARALHRHGPRHDRRFVAVNCSAVVETLFESELFGHVRGAFTGAVDHKVGLFEAASGGTLFLDEIGELAPAMQAKLLRVLETGEIQRVGSTETRRADVCVIAATNRDLRAEVAAGRFRNDLFYRLAVVELKVPPLRERREDIPYLTAATISEFAARLKRPSLVISSGAERLLMSAPWPGNVRELRNVMERACILAETQWITEREIARSLAAAVGSGEGEPGSTPASPAAVSSAASTGSLSDLERGHIVRVLEQTKGNKQAAAAVLGLSRRSLYRRLQRYGLIKSRGAAGDAGENA
jgi:DNA-binding NtrC family response regulator